MSFSEKLAAASMFIWLIFLSFDGAVALIFYLITKHNNVINYLVFIILGIICLLFALYYFFLGLNIKKFIKKGNYLKGKGMISNQGNKMPLILSVSVEVVVNNKVYNTPQYFSATQSARYYGRYYNCLYDEKTIVLLDEIK